MKKFVKAFPCICAAAAFFTLSGLTSGCDDRVRSVGAACGVHGEYMKLPVRINRAVQRDGSVWFRTGQSLEEMRDGVAALKEKGASYTARLFGDKFLYIEKITESVNCYMVARLGAENEYYFDCLLSDLTEGSVGEGGFVTLVPFHLFDLSFGDLNVYGEYNVTADKQYKTNYGLRDFADFYERAGVFSVSATDSEIAVSINDDARIYSDLFARGAFEISFSDVNGTTYASYKITE